MSNQTKNVYEILANRISEYVQVHLDQDIVIDDLAAMVGVSKYHLNRLFQAVTGFQLGEFVQRRRLQRAYALLSSGDCSVIDVSLAVGYGSHSAFSRAFIKAFRCKPIEVKAGSECSWKIPPPLKNECHRDNALQPDIIELPMRQLQGLFGAGFENNSFSNLALSLFSKMSVKANGSGINAAQLAHVGVSLESPWYGDQTACRYFAGFDCTGVDAQQVDALELEHYIWSSGLWAKFHYQGSYNLMWQYISRIYAGWVIPEGVLLRDDAIVQVYLNSPQTTPAVELQTILYFPIHI